nr:uncharacterized protein LOC117988066 [Maniola hyperantus]
MKKIKKKDQGKRTEDPCPCQLFSYACPCTDKKSLTELAKNSKSLTVADQITSTSNFLPQEDNNHKYSQMKKSKCSSYCEDKPTNTNVTGFSKKYEMTAVYEEPVTNNKVISKLIEGKDQNISSALKNGIKVESRSPKKSKPLICPNCKEILEILSTEDEDSLKSKKSLNYHINQTSSPPENQNYEISNMDDTDTCIHDPPCELVPVCQILPTENIYNKNSKCVRRLSLTKHNPKMIRITKACRHHPPCTVVPSCQRLYVLKNNCEFIPPCLHRPRCVNVPLCVPFSKSLNCDDIRNKKIDDPHHAESVYFSPSKMTSAYRQKSLNYANQTCKYVKQYSSKFILSPQMPPTFSPCHQTNQSPCQCCKSDKSCQYECVDCKCIPLDEVKEYASSDDIIYIRDVGCQFRSDNVAPKDSSIQSKTSSASFDLTSAKPGNYYSNYHTLRYEDKCTNHISGEEVSLSTFTTSSLETDAHCPSHGIQASKKCNTGFNPQSTASPFVAAFSTYKDPILQYQHNISDEMSRGTSKSDSIDMLTYLTTFPVKSRRSFLKEKRKKAFSIRRRKKSKRNYTTSSCSSKINHI